MTRRGKRRESEDHSFWLICLFACFLGLDVFNDRHLHTQVSRNQWLIRRSCRTFSSYADGLSSESIVAMTAAHALLCEREPVSRRPDIRAALWGSGRDEGTKRQFARPNNGCVKRGHLFGEGSLRRVELLRKKMQGLSGQNIILVVFEKGVGLLEP